MLYEHFLYFITALELKINFDIRISIVPEIAINQFLIKYIYLQYNNVLCVIDKK